jgi:hypothetical protein
VIVNVVGCLVEWRAPSVPASKTLITAQVFEAHKGRPTIEKCLERFKTVHQIPLASLKNSMRIEAFITQYF